MNDYESLFATYLTPKAFQEFKKRLSSQKKAKASLALKNLNLISAQRSKNVINIVNSSLNTIFIHDKESAYLKGLREANRTIEHSRYSKGEGLNKHESF